MSHISVDLVKEKISAILQHLLENGLDRVDLDRTLYWAVPDKAKFDMASDPDLDVGDLSFDVELIGGITTPLALELLYFSEVLRVIGLEGSRRNL